MRPARALLLGLTATLNPFSFCPTFRDAIFDVAAWEAFPLEQRVRNLRKPETRAAILAEVGHAQGDPG